MSEIVRHELINKHYNDLLVGHFGTKKTKKLVAKRYFWPSLRNNVKIYFKDYDICLVSKVVRYKSYEDLQSLLVSTH